MPKNKKIIFLTEHKADQKKIIANLRTWLKVQIAACGEEESVDDVWESNRTEPIVDAARVEGQAEAYETVLEFLKEQGV